MMDHDKLESVLAERLPGFGKLLVCERLTAGASRETYRLAVQADGADRLLCLRRAPGEGSRR